MNIEDGTTVYVQGFGFGTVKRLPAIEGISSEHLYVYEVQVINENRDVIYFDENGFNKELGLRFLNSLENPKQATAKIYNHPGIALFELAAENMFQAMEFLRNVDAEFAYMCTRDVHHQMCQYYQEHLDRKAQQAPQYLMLPPFEDPKK